LGSKVRFLSSPPFSGKPAFDTCPRREHFASTPFLGYRLNARQGELVFRVFNAHFFLFRLCLLLPRGPRAKSQVFTMLTPTFPRPLRLFCQPVDRLPTGPCVSVFPFHARGSDPPPFGHPLVVSPHPVFSPKKTFVPLDIETHPLVIWVAPNHGRRRLLSLPLPKNSRVSLFFGTHIIPLF